MNHKEQRKLMVLNEVERGTLRSAAAAALLGRSVRQVRRLCAAYWQDESYTNQARRSPNAAMHEYWYLHVEPARIVTLYHFGRCLSI